MMKAATITLIREDPAARGVGTEPTETRRKVFCTVKSIGMQEAYHAMGIGLNPEMKVILAHDFEYKGESLCEVKGIRYRILRTYVTETDGIELTLQRVAGNAEEMPKQETATEQTAGTEPAAEQPGEGVG